MKTLTLIYCNDGNAGKAMAKTIRTHERVVGLRDASVFIGEAEKCDSVIVMDDVQRFYRDRIAAAYRNKVEQTKEVPEQIEQTLIEPKRKRGRQRKVNA